MSPEARAWRYLQQTMRGWWHAQRHEDRLTSGIPDVSWAARGVDGWIELKALEAWPARPETPVDVGLRPDQAEWLTARGRAGGGCCFVLLRVDREWLLYRWTEARLLAGEKFTRSVLYSIVEGEWPHGIDPEEFLDTVTR